MWIGTPLKNSSLHFWVILVATFICIKSCDAITLREEFLLKDEEQLAFDRFKARVVPHISTPYMKSDLVLIKYFRICEMNETRAVDRMKDNLKWRLDRAFEEQLTEDDINEYYRLFPITSFTNKKGIVFFFVPAQYWDVSAAVTTTESSKRFTKYIYHIVEEVYKKGASNITNRTESGIVVFLDLKNVQLQKSVCVRCIEVLKETLSSAEIRWPGGLQFAYAVNGDPILYQALFLIRNTLSEKLQKMCFPFGEDDSAWLPELLKFIDNDKIPPEMYIRSRVQPGIAFSGLPSGLQSYGKPGVAPVPDPGTSNDKKPKKIKKKKKDDDDDDDADG